VAAVVCFAIAIVLSVFPGPAFPFWILGFVLLGYSVGQVLLSLHAIQEWLHRRVPYVDRLPRLRKRHIRAILRQRWVRALDRISAQRDRRRRERERRRRERAARRAQKVPGKRLPRPR
jgi:hypothetical protein